MAVASNFTVPMKHLVRVFEQESDHQINLAFSSSGKIFAQLHHGAPFALFLSADQTKPIALEKQGMIVENSRFTYAIGSLVLWSPTQKPQLHSAPFNSKLLNDLPFSRLAIANPKLAPYGKAAQQTLQALGLYQSLQTKLVKGENIAQTYQFVASGNAQLGFVALSQVKGQKRPVAGHIWQIPAKFTSAHPSGCGVVKACEI